MANIFRIGVIGFAHMHVNHLVERFAAHPQAELTACADTQPLVPELRTAHYTRGWNLRHALEDLGMPKAYDDYLKMLDQEKLDIVVCCSENAQHPAVVEACAHKGVHVMIEKPMASSLQDGLNMARSARAADIELIVNWPVTWQPASHRAKERDRQRRNRAHTDCQVAGRPPGSAGGGRISSWRRGRKSAPAQADRR